MLALFIAMFLKSVLQLPSLNLSPEPQRQDRRLIAAVGSKVQHNVI